MSSIRTDLIAFDTNVFIHALRGTSTSGACEQLIRNRLTELRITVPLHVMEELRRNLTRAELQLLFDVLNVPNVSFGFEPVQSILLERYHSLGAKKGDAIISAQLEAVGIKWLISENRHFLAEIKGLPFKVISAAEAMASLESSSGK
jgi:predicted nucleic acid-binding protein